MALTPPSIHVRGRGDWLGYVAIVAVAAVWCAITFYVYRTKFNGDLALEHESWAQFGDYFGGVTTPGLAFLSLIALLWTIRLQSRELRESRELLKKSASAMERQAFESTFFQMLRRFNEYIGELNGRGTGGRNVLVQLSGDFRAGFRGNVNTNAEVIEYWKNFHRNWRSLLDPYFRLLYHIFKFVNESELSPKEKDSFANVARAQLGNSELTLLFYNGTEGEGLNFRPLIERFGILKHVQRADLLSGTHLENRAFYAETAFMASDERKAVRGE